MKTKIWICTIIFLLFLTSCSPSAVAPTLTPVDVGIVQTEAVETLVASITQTVEAYTPTPAPTETITPTPTLAITETPTIAPTPDGICNRMVFVSDSTVPDNTEMTPGQDFVKTWRVKNTGSCTWKTNYTIAYGWGDPQGKMGGQTTALTGEILPNTEGEISITLKAPTALGTCHGYWRLVDNNGYTFGTTLSVVIVVK